MPILKIDGPKEGIPLVEKALTDLSVHPQVEALFSTEQVATAATPLPVYVLDRNALVHANIAPSLRQSAWRYLIYRGDELASADVRIRKDTGELRFASLEHGFTVHQLKRALDMADEVYSNSRTPYAPAIIEYPKIHAAALWLHSAVSKFNDVFIPYLDGTPKGPPVQNNSDYLKILKNKLDAASRLPPDNRTRSDEL